jgi:hypothetical protein
MNASPCGLVFARSNPLAAELALGIDLSLESSLREIDQVRVLLARAIDGLMAEFGARAVDEAVTALQFQDLSDQLLASATRRIHKVRAALSHDCDASHDAPAEPVRSAGQPAEFF